MARGKPRGAMVTSRPVNLLEEKREQAIAMAVVFEEEFEIGRAWMEPGKLADRMNRRYAGGWDLDRLMSPAVNEYLFIWKRRDTTTY